MCSMTSQGSPYGRFRRALERRDARTALEAARELPAALTLDDALCLCVCLLASDHPSAARAAARWHARFCLEASGVALDEAALVLAALGSLRGEGRLGAASALAATCRRHRLHTAARMLRAP
jgi:hypothetical protein